MRLLEKLDGGSVAGCAMTTPRRRRKPWKITRQDVIVALGLINTLFVFTVGSALELELPLLAVKWFAFLGGAALLVKGILEEREKKDEQIRQEAARQEALRKTPPRGEE
jgi:hypothetical protein